MMLFAVTYHPGLTSEQIYAEFRRWNELHAERHAPKNPVWSNDRTSLRRLRIGYVSPDFATKSSRHFIEPILVGHDRIEGRDLLLRGSADAGQRDPTPEGAGRELALDCGPHRRPARGPHSPRRHRRPRGSWRSHGPQSPSRRSPASRRPVQVAHFLGHGYTSGLSVMDAFLADDALAPEGCDHLFSEPVERLPRMPVAYEPPQGMPDVAPLPALEERLRHVRQFRPRRPPQRDCGRDLVGNSEGGASLTPRAEHGRVPR